MAMFYDASASRDSIPRRSSKTYAYFTQGRFAQGIPHRATDLDVHPDITQASQLTVARVTRAIRREATRLLEVSSDSICPSKPSRPASADAAHQPLCPSANVSSGHDGARLRML
jgi:hypothetical protein